MTSQFFICISRDLSLEAAILFCGDIVVRGRYESNVSMDLFGREQSRVTDDITAPPLLSKMRRFCSMEAAILFWCHVVL